MKPTQILTFLGLLCAAGTATSASAAQAPQGIVPVLVQVDNHGQVTSAEPAFKLSPDMTRLLHQNLDEMISKPAYRHGHAVSSQFVINLAVQSTPRANGDYDIRFAYVSTMAVPSGAWYWVHDGSQHGTPKLALRGSYMEWQPPYHFREPHWPAHSADNYPPQLRPNSRT